MNGDTCSDIIAYHERTKHHYNRYARSAGYMDWENQPHPFRSYGSVPVINLPFQQKSADTHLKDLYYNPNLDPESFSLRSISSFLELSLGLSAWKSLSGNRWPLRMNPSSGNLHPTEAHLILTGSDDLPAGIYHYNPFLHALELRCNLPAELSQSILTHFGADGFLVALSSIYWRESWKYGERAFRYCHHDVGHALAGLSFSAGLQGWQVTYLNAISDEAIETVLGFDRTNWYLHEEEHPDLMCWAGSRNDPDIPRTLPEDVIAAFSDLKFQGTPNRLSRAPVDWQTITRAADLTRKPSTQGKTYDFGTKPLFNTTDRPTLDAEDIIRKRRSATAFDPDGSIERNSFYTILDKTQPRDGYQPFAVQQGNPRVHLLLFVHHVIGMQQGMYIFLRSPADLTPLKNAFQPEFLWHQVTANFPLYLMQEGDFRSKAVKLSCHQDIAGDSAFSMGMIANFGDTVRRAACRYRHLFWECGMIGQVLYLEAEAQGVRGTGIGCFFDDPVHDIIGLKDNTWQSLYHFTIGRPMEDPRLTTLPPYSHLKDMDRVE
jgi:SagB-type dehydrogenase family enzyme